MWAPSKSAVSSNSSMGSFRVSLSRKPVYIHTVDLTVVFLHLNKLPLLSASLPPDLVLSLKAAEHAIGHLVGLLRF